jgi:ATP-dependent Clp protease ATP-binding subunit ClpB
MRTRKVSAAPPDLSLRVAISDSLSLAVAPVHIAFALLNEEGAAAGAAGAAMPGGLAAAGNTSLFASAIARAGGDATTVRRALQKLLVRLPTQSPPPDDISLGAGATKILREAATLQQTMHDSFVAQDHLLLALIHDPAIAPVLTEAGLTEAALKTALTQIRGNRRVESRSAEGNFEALQKYAVDLTALAEEGKIDPVIGRDNEQRRVIRILSRRTKNNPVLIGDPGVGKTSIAEGLAQRIVNRDVPASLLCRLYSLDMVSILVVADIERPTKVRIPPGCSYGRCKVQGRIRGAHQVRPQRGGEVGRERHRRHPLHRRAAPHHVRPRIRGRRHGRRQPVQAPPRPRQAALHRSDDAGRISQYVHLVSSPWSGVLIKSTEYIEKDAALERRFAQVLVNEPTVSETISILRGIREKYEVSCVVLSHE